MGELIQAFLQLAVANASKHYDSMTKHQDVKVYEDVEVTPHAFLSLETDDGVVNPNPAALFPRNTPLYPMDRRMSG
jgi:hypothetical protein